MQWLRSRAAAVALLAVVAGLTIGFGAWQGWLAQAAPDTVYVNDNLLPDIEGCNAPDANTIAAGIAAADPGDTVVICEGVYAGGVVVNKSVTIEGRAEASRATIIVQGASDGFDVTADGVTIRHIKFDGIDHTGNGIHVSGDQVTIQDVEAVRWNLGIYLDASSGSVVEDSDVDGNSGAGILAENGEDNVIRRNTAGGDNDIGVAVDNEELTLVEMNNLSGTNAALFLDADAPDVLKVQILRNTINAGSDGIVIDVLDDAGSLVIIGGSAADANSFAGSPDHTTDNYFVELSCGSEATVNATWNYWAGLNVRSDIADLIYDDEDQNECGDVHGAVVFVPWATEPAPTPSPSPTPTPSPTPSPSPTPGTRTFDLPLGWNSFVWSGPDATDAATALSCIDGYYSIAYQWVAAQGTWLRYVPGRCGEAGMCTLTTVDKYDSLLVLVIGSGVQCTMPVDLNP